MLIFSIFLISDARTLYQSFPNNLYTWGEIFINYEGGFVRRALLGQLLFLVDPLIPVQVFYTAMYSIIFILFMYFSYKKMMNVFDPLVVAFLFIGPGLFLFNLFDPLIFGRKYIFMFIMLLGMAQVCINCFTTQNTLFKNTLALIGLFITGFLVYEVTIFYFPLFAVLLGVAYARDKKTIPWLVITGAVFLTALFVLIFFGVGSEDSRKAIYDSWALRYPDFTSMGGLHYIGTKLTIAQSSMNKLRSPRMVFSVFLASWLSIIPLIFLWKAHNLHNAIKELFSISLMLRIFFGLAVLAPFGIFLIAHDFGTFISTTLMAYLYFMYAVFSIQPQPAATWLCKLKEVISYNTLMLLLLSFIYMFCWSMPHNGFLKPGVIF
jgi:hypothetical protein